MGLMILFPIWFTVDNGVEKMLFALHYTIKTDGVRNTSYFPYVLTAIFAAASVTVAILEIGKFENRLLQLKLGAFNSVLMMGAIGSAVYFAINLIKANHVGGKYDWGLYLPAAAIISNLIANRFIRRDEKLVRDSDRIR
jgi:hypothetical protein